MGRVKQALVERPRLAEGLALACLVVFYLGTTLPNIGNNPIVGGDEGWIISGSAKLAEQGAFGTDLFSGFFHSEDRYYFNLPLHHLMLAAVFKVFGAGLVQARLVSVLFGLVALGLTYTLGRRVGGRYAALGAAALLVLLRLNLTPFTGLTLTDLAATVRYDLIAVPFALGATFVLMRQSEAPTVRQTALAGLLLGLGCLTQFIDALYALPLALFLLTAALPPKRRLALVAVLGLAALAPFLPYFAYISVDWHDFKAQGRTNEQQTDFLNPGFYLDNLRHEPDRYNLALSLDTSPTASEILQRPSARLVLLVLGPLALAFSALKAVRGSQTHRMVALILASLVIELALFESTKRFVYWVIAVPLLCVALADAAAALLAWRPPAVWQTRLALVAVTLPALIIGAEGAAVGLRNLRDARDAPSYAALAASVSEVVPAGSVVLTDNRMWPGLRDMKVRSLLLLFYWTNPRTAEEELTDIGGAIQRTQADYVLLSPLSKEILAKLSTEDAALLQSYLREHGRLLATVGQAPYGPIQIYWLSR